MAGGSLNSIIGAVFTFITTIIAVLIFIYVRKKKKQEEDGYLAWFWLYYAMSYLAVLLLKLNLAGASDFFHKTLIVLNQAMVALASYCILNYASRKIMAEKKNARFLSLYIYVPVLVVFVIYSAVFAWGAPVVPGSGAEYKPPLAVSLIYVMVVIYAISLTLLYLFKEMRIIIDLGVSKKRLTAFGTLIGLLIFSYIYELGALRGWFLVLLELCTVAGIITVYWCRNQLVKRI